MLWHSLLIFLAVTAITPGPSNLTSLYLGAEYGVRGAGKFMAESCGGYFVKCLLCGFLNLALASVVPQIMPVIKWIGALYMLYLGFVMLRSGFRAAEEAEQGEAVKRGYPSGIVLQIFNMKSWVVCLSIFSVYVMPYTRSITQIVVVSLVSLLLVVISTLLWCACGKLMEGIYKRYQKLFGVLLAAGLVYCAVTAVL